MKPARVCIVDTTGITNFTPKVREPGVPFLHGLRDGGVTLVLATSASGLVRMTGMAISLAARLPLQFVGSMDEAIAAADAHIASGK
jgi:hypothetical protein